MRHFTRCQSNWNVLYKYSDCCPPTCGQLLWLAYDSSLLSWPTRWCPLRWNPASPWQLCLLWCTQKTTSTHSRWVHGMRWRCMRCPSAVCRRFSSMCWQSVPKPPPAPPSKKRKRVMEEPPVVLVPKPLLSGAVPLEAFLATLQKVWHMHIITHSWNGTSILLALKIS